MSAISYTCHAKRPFSDSLHSVLYAHFRHFWHQTHSSPSRSSEKKTCRVEIFGISFILSVFHVSSSSYPEETPNSLDDKVDGFTSFIPVFTAVLIGLLLPHQRGPLLLFAFCCLLCFSQRDIQHLILHTFHEVVLYKLVLFPTVAQS